MEPFVPTDLRSINYGDEAIHTDIKDLESSVMAPDNNNNSFTALLELPPIQAVELLHSGDSRGAAKFTVFANEDSNLSAGLVVNVKAEPMDSGSNPNSLDPKPLKRKERENNGKSSRKKSKATANSSCNDGEKLPYVHVRARRGQATNSHSLAERVRREKINARMKLLQELVPGCNKISGTALVLDEIINHVQSLQRQVEYLSMRLSAVNPRINLNLDSLVSAETEPMMECNMSSTSMPLVWPEIHVKGDTQQLHFNSWCQAENSLLSYGSSPNSGLQSSQLKMEL